MRDFANLKPDEVLQLAIAVEKANAKRFEVFATMFESYEPTVSKVFRDLVEEEKTHQGRLEKEYEKKFGALTISMDEDEVREVIEAVDLADAEHFIFDDLTPVNALRAALKAEKDARQFYAKVAATTSDAALKRLYDELSGFEADHIRYLEERVGNLAQKESADAEIL